MLCGVSSVGAQAEQALGDGFDIPGAMKLEDLESCSDFIEVVPIILAGPVDSSEY